MYVRETKIYKYSIPRTHGTKLRKQLGDTPRWYVLRPSLDDLATDMVRAKPSFLADPVSPIARLKLSTYIHGIYHTLWRMFPPPTIVVVSKDGE